MDVNESRLVQAEIRCELACHQITTKLYRTRHNNAGSRSYTKCFQVLAMAAIEEWRVSQNSHVHRLILLSVNSTCISTYTEASQTLLTWQL